MTAKEIAQALELSTSAVSLALNNKPGVSEETRNRILEFAEKNGYDLKKRELKSDRRRNVLFLIYQEYSVALDYKYISMEMFEGITEECQKNRCILSTMTVDSDQKSIEHCIEEIRQNSVDGILILGTSINEAVANEFLKIGIPTVLVDSPLDNVYCSRVCINNTQGAYQATDYLIKMRHSQPGYISSNIRLSNFIEREVGFKKALKVNGLSASQSIRHELSPSINGAFADFMSILENKTPIADCYFADNDLLAIGVVRALQTAGYKVPEDVAVIGFDNIEFCRVLQPQLTSVSFSRKYLGQMAMNHLLNVMDNKSQPNVKIEVDVRLVKRFSV